MLSPEVFTTIRPAAAAFWDMMVRSFALTPLEFEISSAGLVPLFPRMLYPSPLSIALLASNLSEPLMSPVIVYCCPAREIGAECVDMVPLGNTVIFP
jgi:hypothetical protein